jgi:hypothetical protein
VFPSIFCKDVYSHHIQGMTFVDPDPEYNVTKLVVNAIGGTGQGGATSTAPVGGWNTPGLEAVLKATRTPTALPPSGKRKISGGAIAGAVIGVVVGVSLIGGVAVMYFHRRRLHLARAPPTDLNEPDSKERNELEGDGKPPVEVAAKGVAWEMEADHGHSEASPVTSTAGRAELQGDDALPENERAELSAENVAEGGRLGVPRIETTTVEDNPDGWVGEKKEAGVESPAQDGVRPDSRDFPSWEEVKDEKKKDGGK